MSHSTMESSQEREIRDLLRRADRTPDRKGSLRRDTLMRLIDLSHSSSPTMKTVVATNIKNYICDFPELEDEAINAVYDLCEDPLPEIRIEGYNAITNVSREQNKWVKRNADVLVQLLQSDEPEEVRVVKKALSEHLDMDPRVTLGVLCDQIVFQDELADEEEQMIRDKLRALVISFLTGEAKRAITERYATNSNAEEALIDGLLQGVDRLGHSEVETIVKDLLLCLPSYRAYSRQGTRLLEAILARVRASLSEDLRPLTKQVTLASTQNWLDLATYVSMDPRVAQSSQLLRFYCSSLVNRMTLLKLSKETQVAVIADLLDIMLSPNPKGKQQRNPEAESMELLRKQVIEHHSAIILERLVESGLQNQKSLDSCRKLLIACRQHKDEQGWTLPRHLVTLLQKLQGVVEQQEKQNKTESAQNVQSLIRLLLPVVKKPAIEHSASDTNVLQGKSAGKVETKVVNPAKRKLDDRTGATILPPRPASAGPSANGLRNGQFKRPDGTVQPAKPPVPANVLSAGSSKSVPRPQQSQGQPDDFQRTQKRRRQDDKQDSQQQPSLLSRMKPTAPAPSPAPPVNGSSTHPGQSLRILGQGSSQAVSRPQVQPVRPPRRRSPQPALVPSGGLSIKGAAQAASRSQTAKAPAATSLSLLDRINGGNSLASRVESEDAAGRKRRRKGKTAQH